MIGEACSIEQQAKPTTYLSLAWGEPLRESANMTVHACEGMCMEGRHPCSAVCVLYATTAIGVPDGDLAALLLCKTMGRAKAVHMARLFTLSPCKGMLDAQLLRMYRVQLWHSLYASPSRGRMGLHVPRPILASSALAATWACVSPRTGLCRADLASRWRLSRLPPQCGLCT